nr:[Asp1,Val5]angiotensin II [Amphiuma tridactylum=three-toed amphiumas, plasma, Peptide, 8 aa] [Amphiuma tridactylum]prf//0402224A angiotensin [Elaphe climacophora]
DRVYVHPF